MFLFGKEEYKKIPAITPSKQMHTLLFLSVIDASTLVIIIAFK